MDNIRRNPQTVLLVTSSSLEEALYQGIQPGREKPITWVYIGKSYQDKKRCREILGSCACEADICHDLDEVAGESVDDYISLMERLNDANRDNLVWWFSPVSTRCPLLTDIFPGMCYVRLIERMCDNCRVPQLIIAESPDLLGIVNQVLVNRVYPVALLPVPGCEERKGSHLWSGRRKAGFFNQIPSFLCIRGTVLPGLFTAYRFLKKTYHRRLYAYKSRKSAGPVYDQKNTVLIATYFLPDSMAGGTFQDRYHPYLYDYLKEKGYTILVYPRFYEDNPSLELYKSMRRNRDRILIPEDYLSWSDYLYGLLYCLYYRNRLNLSIHPDDPCRFLQDLIRKETDNFSIFEILTGFLTYRASGKIVGKNKNIRSVILWNENQYGDRGIIRAARTKSPGIPIIGFRGYIHITNYFNIIPLESEVRASLTPTRFLITGANQKEFITKYGKDLKFSIAAALRYNHIFLEKTYDPAFTTMHPRECIVIILPGMEQAYEIIDTVYSSVQEGNLSLPCYVRDHPNCPFKSVESEEMKGFFTRYTGTIAELPLMYPIVISGTSSTIIETLCMGIPSIFLARENSINFDLITSEVPHYYRCCSGHELVTIINTIMNRNKTECEEIIQFSSRIQEEFFTPISEESMKPFIEDITSTES